MKQDKLILLIEKDGSVLSVCGVYNANDIKTAAEQALDALGVAQEERSKMFANFESGISDTYSIAWDANVYLGKDSICAIDERNEESLLYETVDVPLEAAIMYVALRANNDAPSIIHRTAMSIDYAEVCKTVEAEAKEIYEERGGEKDFDDSYNDNWIVLKVNTNAMTAEKIWEMYYNENEQAFARVYAEEAEKEVER